MSHRLVAKGKGNRERRGRSAEEVFFRTTMDNILAIADRLPPSPSAADIEPISRLARSALERVVGNRAFEHKLRNVLTISTLAGQLATSDEAVTWLKDIIRGAPLPPA